MPLRRSYIRYQVLYWHRAAWIYNNATLNKELLIYSLNRALYLQPMLNDAAIRIRSVSTSTYVKTSTNQEEPRDELILSEDQSERPAYS